MARLNSGTRIYGSANVDGMLVVGQITPNNANVGLANTGSLQVWGGAYISGNTTIGGQSTTEQVYVQGNSNLLTYSQNLENAAWAKSTSIVRFGPSANTYAPDGTNTVSQLINNTGGVDTGYVDQYFTRANRNTPYTFSTYVKQGSCPFAQINMFVYDGTVSNAQANVNFSTGTVAVAGVNLVNSTFVNVGGGWYRVSITLNSLVHSQIICRLYLRPPGVAGEFGYFWGAQLEPGITPSAYANTSSGNIVKANNNLFVMGNTFVLGGNTSISNTTGSLIVHGGLGVSGNVFVSNSVSIISESAMNRFAQISGGQAGATAPGIGTTGGTECFDIFSSSNQIRFYTGGAKMVGTVAVMNHVASPVNYIQFAGNTTGGGVVISGQGSDTNVGINITPKGAGSANVTSTANSTSNTTGALVVTGGMGITGNLFMSAANNYITSTSSASYRLGWTDNYFQRSGQFGGMLVQGSYFELDTTTYLGIGRNFIARGLISNDQGNNTVLFAPSSPVRLQNTAASTSNTTGSLIVGGGLGVSGSIFSNSFITSTENTNYVVRLDGTGIGGSGPRLQIGTPSNAGQYLQIGAYNDVNNFETTNRNFRLGSTAVTNIMLANATTGVVTFANSVVISGNLTVVGNVNVENVQSFAVSDPLIQLGIGNYTSDLRDIGFAAHYNAGTNAHTGLIRDFGTKEYYLFQGYTPELNANNNLIISDPSFGLANINADIVRANLVANNIIVRGAITDDEGNNVVIFGTSSPVLIQNGTASTSNTTGSLIVNGGVGIRGNTYVSGIFVGGQNNTANGEFSFVGGGGGLNVGDGNAAAGANSAIVGGQGNLITSTGLRGFIGGGLGNRISGSASNSVIVGGSFNSLTTQHGFLGGGYANQMTNDFAVLNGGFNNGSTGAYGVVGGGIFNTTPGSYSVVSGGYSNQSANDYSVISGGRHNTANGNFSFIGGGGGTGTGDGNYVAGANSAIVGGASNWIVSGANHGFIGGGLSNRIVGTFPYNVIGGGNNNNNGGNVSTIGGGQNNDLNGTNWGTIAGGSNNGSAWNYTFIGGGNVNQAIQTGAVVVGGSYNTANGFFSFVGGGGGTSITDRNTAAASNSAIVGGATNYIASGADYSFIGGGQNHRIDASADYSTIAGGSNHNSQNIYNFIGGGTSSFAYSQYGVVCGGFNNSVQFLAVVGGGQFNNATGSYSFVGGGTRNTATGAYSAILGGNGASTRSVNFAQAMGNDPWSKVGSSQLGKYILSANTNSATANTMTTDWTYPASATNQVVLVANSAYMFSGSVVGTEIDGADTSMWTFQGGIKRGASVGSTALVGTPVINLIAQDGGANSWSVAITANTTLGSLQVSVVGDPSATVRWVGRVDTTEVTF